MAMSVQDMVDQGVEFQGWVRVCSFDEDGFETIYYEGDPENDPGFNDVGELWHEGPVKFMWAARDGLHIELETEGLA